MKSRLLILVFGLFAASQTAAQADYTFSSISDPGAAGYTTANGINSAGVIVGTFSDGAATHGYLLDGGTFSGINFPGADNTTANGISDSNLVVGGFTFGGTSGGYSIVGGAFAAAPWPGPVSGVSTNMAFASGYYDNGATTVGVIYPTGVTALLVPGSISTFINGVNSAGVGVGYYTNGSGSHSFTVTSGGSITLLPDDPSGMNATFATSINDIGDIGGYFIDMGGQSHGFLLKAGSFTGIDVPFGFGNTQVLGLNNSDALVGSYLGIGGITGFAAAVIPVPTPEPASVTLLGIGLAGLIARRRRAA